MSAFCHYCTLWSRFTCPTWSNRSFLKQSTSATSWAWSSRSPMWALPASGNSHRRRRRSHRNLFCRCRMDASWFAWAGSWCGLSISGLRICVSSWVWLAATRNLQSDKVFLKAQFKWADQHAAKMIRSDLKCWIKQPTVVSLRPISYRMGFTETYKNGVAVLGRQNQHGIFHFLFDCHLCKPQFFVFVHDLAKVVDDFDGWYVANILFTSVFQLQRNFIRLCFSALSNCSRSTKVVERTCDLDLYLNFTALFQSVSAFGWNAGFHRAQSDISQGFLQVGLKRGRVSWNRGKWVGPQNASATGLTAEAI